MVVGLHDFLQEEDVEENAQRVVVVGLLLHDFLQDEVEINAELMLVLGLLGLFFHPLVQDEFEEDDH